MTMSPWPLPRPRWRLVVSRLRKARVRLGPPPSPNRKKWPYKGTIVFQGIPIYVENPRGSVRRGVSAGGERWATTMRAHYGEFAETLGMDGDPIDVFVGPAADAPRAYVVHQKVPGTQVMDEDKVILGCHTAAEAKALYLQHYDRAGFFGGMTPWPVAELRAFLGKHGTEGRRLDTPRRAVLRAERDGDDAVVEKLTKGGLHQLLKATIATPKKADGGVDYDSVPVGASIWVTVTAESSPLHGRPILIQKRPDHQFALMGGSGAKHIQGRRHLTMAGGKTRQTKADEKLAAERKQVEARNAPRRAVIREHRRAAKKAQREAEAGFMEALGIERRGLSTDEKARVKEAARAHAEAAGLKDKEAASFARHVANGIARRDKERRVRQAARRLEQAKWVHQGLAPTDAEAMAGPPVGAVAVTAPEVPDDWSEMSEAARENHVGEALADQVSASRDAWRFDPEDRHEASPVIEDEDPTKGLTVTPSANPKPVEPTPEPTPADATSEARPTFTIGEDVQAKPIVSRAAATEALDRFREYAASAKSARDASKELEAMPEGEPASPASVDELRLRARALSPEELDQWMGRYAERAAEPIDTSFYAAMSPHWNEDIGNKLNGAVTLGASAALTGLVGSEIAARYDVQRIVDALGPEAAAIAVAQRMREEMTPAAYSDFVSRVRDHNAENQRATERKALARHRELQSQSRDLEGQVAAGDLASEANITMLRARNLLEQRENLGGALGSLQASAALYDAAEKASATGWKKRHPVTISVSTRAALEDKLARLGRFRHAVSYDVGTGTYKIATDTQALRKFVGRTAADVAHNAEMRAVKFDDRGITHDAEGREWVHDYKVPGFRTHLPAAEHLTKDLQHLAGKPVSLMADQRNNIEWLTRAGGGLVSMRTGGGKTLVSIGVASKLLHNNPSGRHLRVVPDGREEQWANEVRTFTIHPVVVLPARSKKEERHALLRSVKPGTIVIVGHKNAGRYDHKALAETHEWDSVAIDEPQEMRGKSGRMSAGARRIFKIPAAHRHALTATPATDSAVEAYDIVNWTNPGKLGFRTRFERAFKGFGGGTNAQDAALQRALNAELEPHVSPDRQVRTHYKVNHHDVPVRQSESQRASQRAIEARADHEVEAAVQAAYAKRREGVRGYADKSHRRLRKEATARTLARLESEHRVNLGAGTVEHNPKLAALRERVTSGAGKRHAVFVDSPDQRRAVVAMMKEMGRPVYNIDASARGATRRGPDGPIAAIESRKSDWKGSEDGVIIIDRTSASGHNLAEGHHLHVLGDPGDAAELLQAHGRLGRANREGDFDVHTYRIEDSPFAHHTWNRLHRQMKVLQATAPGLFVGGRQEQATMSKGGRLVIRRG